MSLTRSRKFKPVPYKNLKFPLQRPLTSEERRGLVEPTVLPQRRPGRPAPMQSVQVTQAELKLLNSWRRRHHVLDAVRTTAGTLWLLVLMSTLALVLVAYAFWLLQVVLAVKYGGDHRGYALVGMMVLMSVLGIIGVVHGRRY